MLFGTDLHVELSSTRALTVNTFFKKRARTVNTVLKDCGHVYGLALIDVYGPHNEHDSIPCT